MAFLNVGELKINGYTGELIDFTISHQLLDENTWKLFVDQFRIKSDGQDNGWRGEYWGKMLRGGALTYRVTGNRDLYGVLKSTILDMISTADKDGRISTYNRDKEFCGWDMWSRKYVILGMLYFYDVAKSETLKSQILKCCIAQVDYIIKHIGDGAKDILDTSTAWGTINSCSILEPIVRLFAITGDKRYSQFCDYIIGKGFCKGENIYALCLNKEKYPYQFQHPKAYELMSCFEGLLEYYKLTKTPNYLNAVKNFVDMVAETDYTIIGCCGCKNELFNNSSLQQTEPSDDVMQETCVSVTFMKLCAKLYSVTRQEKYIAMVEKTAYNAMFGAVNNRDQTMVRCMARGWIGTTPVSIPHESYPFDSYSPLYENRRARLVGGFKELQNGRSYGCCACIGSAGTAIAAIATAQKDGDALTINLYQNATITARLASCFANIKMYANMYNKPHIRLKVSGGKFIFNLRVPTWAKNFTVSIGGKLIDEKVQNGYISLEQEWNKTAIDISFEMPIIAHVLNGKIAFTRGPIVLARDCRFGDITKPLPCNFKDGQEVAKTQYKIVKNDCFTSNLTIKLKLKDAIVILCDYSEAGKNYDDEECSITVWQNIK